MNEPKTEAKKIMYFIFVGLFVHTNLRNGLNDLNMVFTDALWQLSVTFSVCFISIALKMRKLLINKADEGAGISKSKINVKISTLSDLN